MAENFVFQGKMYYLNENDYIRAASKIMGEYANPSIILERVGDCKMAITDCTEAIRRDPNDIQAYFCRGLGYCGVNNYAMAKEDFTKVIKKDPNNAAAFFNRGFAKSHEEKGESEGFFEWLLNVLINAISEISDFKKAVKLAPDNSLYREALQKAKAGHKNFIVGGIIIAAIIAIFLFFLKNWLIK